MTLVNQLPQLGSQCLKGRLNFGDKRLAEDALSSAAESRPENGHRRDRDQTRRNKGTTQLLGSAFGLIQFGKAPTGKRLGFGVAAIP
jgi:hypothetical protein